MINNGHARAGRPPRGLGATGRRLWQTFLTARSLDAEAQARLLNLCRLSDELERLRAALAEAPVLTTGSMGQVRPNPLFEQVRSHTATLNDGLARLVQSSAPVAPPAGAKPLDALDRLRLCHQIRVLRGGGGPRLPCWRLDELPDGATCPSCNYVMHEQFSHADEECSVCRDMRARRQRINAAARANGADSA
jgi:hypothetical protein